MDNKFYARNIMGIRDNICTYDQVEKCYRTRTNPEYDTYKLLAPRDESSIRLIYHVRDLYIEGFYNKDNVIFTTNNSHYTVGDRVVLPYGNEYGELGYDRTVETTRTLNVVTFAIEALANATPSKAKSGGSPYANDLVTICLAFAEAVRFDDVYRAILLGRPFDDVDWDQHRDQSMVRVQRS